MSEWFSELVHGYTRTHEERNLGTDFPIFNYIDVIGARLSPWFNDRITNQPD
jgi:hypothetical protein